MRCDARFRQHRLAAGNAGDEQTMKTTDRARRFGGSWRFLGRIPGYPDRANFGRLELKLR